MLLRQPAAAIHQSDDLYRKMYHFVQPGQSLRQPGTSLRQPATSLRQPATSLRQPATSLRQPATSLRQPGATYIHCIDTFSTIRYSIAHSLSI